jgi:hypothetical protein
MPGGAWRGSGPDRGRGRAGAARGCAAARGGWPPPESLFETRATTTAIATAMAMPANAAGQLPPPRCFLLPPWSGLVIRRGVECAHYADAHQGEDQ